MNLIIQQGNLTRDPELKKVGDADKVSFGIAVNGRPYTKNGERKQDVVFWDCEAWAGGATLIAEHFTKGKAIQVIGEVREDSWEDKTSGQMRYKKYIRVEKFHFVPDGKRKDSEDGGESGSDETPATTPATKTKAKSITKRQPAPVVSDDDGSEEIPF